MTENAVRATTIQDLVARQFGPQAAAYVASTVHAAGEDLEDLRRRLEGRAGDRLLDLGCGGGHVSFAAAPLVAEVVAYDLAPEMLAAVAATAAQRGLANIVPRQGTAEALPFGAAEFDRVASRYSAHHWRDLPRGLAEARRVVKSDGRAIFMDVVAPENPLLDTYLQSFEVLRDPSHVRDYAISQWTGFAHAAGFRVENVVARRLRLEFAPWIARMATPATQVAAIRALQACAPEEVRAHFAFEADGTFTLDTMTVELAPV
ncbi:class I SAM-dependent methyltransferase [Aquabacter spiritensis]|uniref:Methyltransferase family protein n=1 Tax=Aquabacter spiritensis TaxID=933073 RepID=A0A4R3M185_9HYPH|nr:class I SAM-dependent methyltransferase [Aquabacter spiritensis]TCT06871.1 methyltransferase family protein [Aquabacter spiritensis]